MMKKKKYLKKIWMKMKTWMKMMTWKMILKKWKCMKMKNDDDLDLESVIAELENEMDEEERK